MRDYFLFAGEPSGDLHGSKLMQAIHALDKEASFGGVGGPLMRLEGISGPLSMENFQVMGFSDVLKALPKLVKLFYQVRNDILSRQPQVVILIDYPGFNLRMAKALRKKGFKGKIVQYICPTVWAHGRNRIKGMSQTLDLLLTIFPFESGYFSHTNLKVKYIGNPLVENFKKWQYDHNWRMQVGLSPHEVVDEKDLIALFPGSREAEVRRHLPLQLQTANLLIQKFPQMKFAISYSSPELFEQILSEVKKSGFKIGRDLFFVPPKYRYELMHECQIALAKSGTVTLELALHKKPGVVIYQLTKLNYFIAKYILRLKLPYYCMVNILGRREIYPELIGTDLSAGLIEKKLSHLHQDSSARNQIVQACEEVSSQLEEKESHHTAAQAILELFK